jgi:hypothetical protein
MEWTSKLWAGKTRHQVYRGPAGPPVNSSSVGSCLRLLVLLWLLSRAAAAAQNPEIPPLSPQPATSAPQFQGYLDRTYGWQPLSWLATDTAIDLLRSRPEWGRGPGGFGCQYASAFGRRLISNSAELAVGLELHEDTGFHPSQRRGFLPRMQYAMTHAFLASVPGGKFEPAYARFAAITSGALVAPAWHQRSLSASGFFEDFTFGMLGQLQNSLLNEFSPDLQKLGRNVRKKVLRK